MTENSSKKTKEEVTELSGAGNADTASPQAASPDFWKQKSTQGLAIALSVVFGAFVLYLLVINTMGSTSSGAAGGNQGATEEVLTTTTEQIRNLPPGTTRSIRHIVGRAKADGPYNARPREIIRRQYPPENDLPLTPEDYDPTLPRRGAGSLGHQTVLPGEYAAGHQTVRPGTSAAGPQTIPHTPAPEQPKPQPAPEPVPKEPNPTVESRVNGDGVPYVQDYRY